MKPCIGYYYFCFKPSTSHCFDMWLCCCDERHVLIKYLWVFPHSTAIASWQYSVSSIFHEYSISHMDTGNERYKWVSSDSVGNCLPACNFRQYWKRSKCKIHHFRILHGLVTLMAFVSENQQINCSHPFALFSTMKDLALIVLWWSDN